MSAALLYLFSCLLLNILVFWPTKVSSDDDGDNGDKNCAFCLPSSADGRSPIASPHHRSLLANGGRCVRPGTALFKWPEECPLPQLRSRQVSLDPSSGIVFAEQRHCARRTQNDYWTVAVEVRCSDAQMWRNAKMKISLALREQQKLRSLAKRWLRRRNPRNSRIHFKEDKYVVELPENAPVRSVIVQVQAHNEADQPLYYAFGVPEDSRSANLFSLDTVSGEVRLAKALDRETQQRHVLKVVAFERLDPSQSATVSAIVEVLDVQDNAPSFEKATYVAEIREDAPIGTTVLSVFARDFDDGANGEVTYSLKNVKDGPELAHLFSINSKSGVVQTAAQLDHESLPPLQLLQAIATDAGQPPMRSSANLEISVLDVNDNAPLFELNGTACEANVSEDAPVPSAILRPRARDADSGANGKVHYSIVTMSAPLFSIDYESGQVTLRHRATPKQSPLTLLIRAKDGGQPSLFSTLQCSVTIIDVNDHSPAFIGIGTAGGDRLELFVDENAPIGREIGRLLAVDGDSGQNGEIRYRIAAVLEENKGKVPPPPPPFELDPITGAFKTTEKLDRESRAEFIFNVLAADCGEPSRNASIEIKIRVKDINDNSPFFPQTFYQIELDEDAPRGHKLLSLRAQDADEGDSQKLTYRLVRQTPAAADLFALTNMGQEQGAVLSLAREFSPEDDKFLLQISATDEDGLSGHCNVSIKVKDVNRPPRLVPHQFLIRIDENAPIGAPVAKMEATDEDRGDNARLKFAINSAEFGIDPQNGLITVREALDREKQPVYTVDVRVEDGGNPSLSAGTLLEIVLDDVNDNVPHFLSAEYRASIPEDIPVGTSFLQVHAEDPDEGPNGQIDYLLDSDDPFVRMDRFRLDRTSGTLRVNQPLDRENVSKFVLPLIGRDRGSPRPLSTRTLVEVTVEDVNDNAPNFEFPSYDFYVPENSLAGTLVGEVSAADPDLGENARIEFRIFGGTDAKFFELDRDQSEEQQHNNNNKGTVRIRTRQQFDFEATQNKFSVELQATSGQLSTTVPVRVHILDVNDHPPQLADPFVVLVAQFVGDDGGGQDEEWPELAQNTTIGQVPAFDPDQNATLEFAIEKNPLIDVHPQTGILTLLYANWQRQIDSEQRICVSDGPNIACAKALFHLVPISTELLRSSAVSVFVEGVQQDELLSSGTFLRFLQAISSLWDWAVPENIRVFSLDEEHRRHANGTQLAGTVVNLFINRHSEMGEESAISSWLVEDAIEELRTNLSALFGAPLHLKRESLCVSEPCPYFQRCRSALRFLRLQDTLSTDDFIFRPISTLRTFSCECPRGFTTNASVPGECNQRLNQCFNGPCLHGGTCHPLEGGFRCACPAGRTGKNCELATFGLITCLPGFCFSGAQCQIQMPDRSPACAGCPWRPIDSDERCRLRSVSFGGDSFLAVPKAPSRMEWTFGLSFATISSAGTLFFAGSADGDFVHLYLEGGVPQIQFSLGGNDSFGGKLADIKANFVNDGDWHSVKLQYSEWKMRISVDNCDVQSSLLLGTLSSQCAVEVAVPLAKKCLLDTAVPCHRFLDLPKSLMIGGFGPSGAKKFVGIPFVGVVKDLQLDGQLVHFSNWEQLERVGPNIWPGAQKYRPDRCLMSQEKSLCPEQTRCLDRWLGHHCRCHLRVHSPDLNCPSLQAGQEAPALTMAEDSFAVWRLPSEFSLPFSLHFEFRSRESKTQVITLDFELSAQMLIFSLENGQSIIRVNNEQYLLPYPALADGNWHSVDAHFTIEALQIVVDALYKKSVPLMALSTPRTVHSGTVPSSAHPAAFFGCIRNVEWDGQRLRLANQSATRQSCLAPNACQMAATQCPVNSKCVRDWDRHNCKCNLGYIGDSCVDACAVPNICGPFPNTICVRSANAPRGYECVCPDGRTGQNCENVALPAECPEGWFGQFPKCKRCFCPFENGFATQCNSTNGQCICREGTFLVSNLAEGSEHRRCVLCRCGYGTAPGALERCDRHSGQCNCVGDATGRQCDRCEQKSGSNKKLPPLLLERRSLKCVPIHGRCPSQMESDVQWPTTPEGTTARHSCAQPMMGIATRVCSENGIWSHVNDFNCTLPSLFELQNRIFESDAQNAQLFDWSRRLANVTRQNRHDLRGENVQIVVKLLNELVRLEMAKNGTNLAGEANGGGVESARGNHFALNLLQVADILLAEELSHHKLAINLANYGAFLTDLYERFRFLRPFKFGGRNLVFVIDKLDAKVSPVVVTLPPIGDSLFRHRHQISHANAAAVRVQLEVAHQPTTNVSSVRIFYSAFISGSKKDFSTVLSLYASKEIVTNLNTLNIALPIADPFGHYECMAKYAEGHWQNVHLVGLNGTHAQCQIARGDGPGKWPLFIKAIANQKSAGVKFFPFAGCNRGHYSTVFSPIPIICTLCAMFAFALLALAFAIALCRQKRRYRMLRCTVIAAFSLNALCVQLSRRVLPADNDGLFCAALNSILAASICALFAWLLLYSLFLCKLVLQSADKNCSQRWNVTFGVILPFLVSVAVFIMSTKVDECRHVPIGSAPFWLLTVPPAILCLLNFYSLATSWMLSWHKQYQLIVLRFSFRRVHFSHSVLVFLCAILSIMDLLQLFRPFPSPIFAILNAVLLAFIAIHFVLWANFFIATPKEDNNAHSSTNSDKSAESIWMAREAEAVHQAPVPVQSQFICPDSSARANFYANSPFHRGISPFTHTAKRRPRLSDGKVYEGIPNEWIPPGGEGGDSLTEEPTYLHHTLQRSLEVGLPHILSPPQHPAPPSSMVDGKWPLDVREQQQPRQHFLSGTLPIGGASNFVRYSPLQKQIGLKQRHHYGSVHAIDRNEMTPNTRRRTQPIQFPAAHNGSLKNVTTESTRSRKFGLENVLDDELNCAYFTFTRRRDQLVVDQSASSAATTFN